MGEAKPKCQVPRCGDEAVYVIDPPLGKVSPEEEKILQILGKVNGPRPAPFYACARHREGEVDRRVKARGSSASLPLYGVPHE